jgi:hypothetical protein
MLRQTGGEWSAPLDDVFIHFDYARATARGYPFQWSDGNGYSSGNTSLLYPFVLAAGYVAGFRESSLMVWAGVVACTSVFALLVASQRLFASEPAWAKYFGPPAVFAIGALDWSLFSGMEVALFLGVWSAVLVLALDQVERATAPPANAASTSANDAGDLERRPRRTLGNWGGWRDWSLGLGGAALVVTRPEGATSVAALGLMVAAAVRRERGTRAALAQLGRTAAPAMAILVVQSVANRWLTGEFAASGSIVKLTLYNPFMTAREKLDEYLFLLKYVVFRNTEYHFADAMPYGYIVPALAVVPLFFRRSRLIAITLCAGALAKRAVHDARRRLASSPRRARDGANRGAPRFDLAWRLAQDLLRVRGARRRARHHPRMLRRPSRTEDARPDLVFRARQPQYPRSTHYRGSRVARDDAAAEARARR